jgi:hypothetical protein
MPSASRKPGATRDAPFLDGKAAGMMSDGRDLSGLLGPNTSVPGHTSRRHRAKVSPR